VTIVVQYVRVFSKRGALPPLSHLHRLVLSHGHFAAEEVVG